MKIKIDEDQLQELKMILDLVSEKVNLLTIEISRRTDHIQERDHRQEELMKNLIKIMESYGNKLTNIEDQGSKIFLRSPLVTNFDKKGEQNETEGNEVQELKSKSKRIGNSEEEKT